MANTFYPGQRWISEGEPELGLGEVRAVAARTVTVVFEASEATREYAKEPSPLRRVRFRAGDTLQNREALILKVEAVVERHGLLFYQGAEEEWCET